MTGSVQNTHFFEEAERKFNELRSALQSLPTLQMQLSDVEKLIETEGREVLRLFE